MFKFILAYLLLAAPVCFADQFKSWPEACAAAEDKVKEGDLIFLDMPDYVFRNVAKATNSWTSHVGVAFKNELGQFVVAESTIPLSREIPLCEFLSGSAEFRFEIKRFHRDLTKEEIARMHQTARSMLGRLYTLGFNFDSRFSYCSKFAHLTYLSAGIHAGQVQTFRELLAANPGASLTFWKFWFLGRIPWDRRTVTPASQLNDPQFYTVLVGEE